MYRFDARNFFPVSGFLAPLALMRGCRPEHRLWGRESEMTACVASGQPSGHSPGLSASLNHMRTLSAQWPSLWSFFARM